MSVCEGMRGDGGRNGKRKSDDKSIDAGQKAVKIYDKIKKYPWRFF